MVEVLEINCQTASNPQSPYRSSIACGYSVPIAHRSKITDFAKSRERLGMESSQQQGRAERSEMSPSITICLRFRSLRRSTANSNCTVA
ncbi:hypothetical protein CKA32_003251 [Geitlerinema sp. FC II]|nr:hypothetical protein CKA32_003251 [Geitlerinema sp. FC II]